MVSHKDEKLSNYNGCSLKALYYYTQGNDMASSFLNFRKSAEAFMKYILYDTKAENDVLDFLTGGRNFEGKDQKGRTPLYSQLMAAVEDVLSIDEKNALYFLKTGGVTTLHDSDIPEPEKVTRDDLDLCYDHSQNLTTCFYKRMNKTANHKLLDAYQGKVGESVLYDYADFSELMDEVDLFNPRNKYILISPDKFDSRVSFEQKKLLKRVPWSIIVDFDLDSKGKNGLFTSFDAKNDNRYVPLTISQFEDGVLPISTSSKRLNWVFAKGLKQIPDTLCADVKEWKQRKYVKFIKSVFSKYYTATTGVFYVICLSDSIKYLQAIIDAFEDIDEVEADLIHFVFVSPDDDFLAKISDVAKEDSFNSYCYHSDTMRFLMNLAESTACVLSETNSCMMVPAKSGDSMTLTDVSSFYANFVDGGIEVVYTGIANGKTSNDDVGKSFFDGNIISWVELSQEVCASRNIYKRLIELITHRLSLKQSNKLVLGHNAGAGGTTLSRQLAYTLRQEHPVVVLNKYVKNVTQRMLSNLYSRVHTSVLVVVESSNVANNYIDSLIRDMNSIKQIFVFLVVERKNRDKHANPQSEIYLSANMQDADEKNRFEHKVELYGSDETLKQQLRIRQPKDCEVIDFTLAISQNFDSSKIQSYVRFHNDQLSEPLNNFVMFVCMVYHYSQKGISDVVFRNLFHQGDGTPISLSRYLRSRLDEKKNLDALLTMDCDENGTPVSWRPRYACFAEALLNESSGTGKWVDIVYEISLKLIDCIKSNQKYLIDETREILKCVFLQRGKEDLLGVEEEWVTRESNSHFSQLLADVGVEISQRNILAKLAKSYPNESHFWLHLARFCYEKASTPHDFDEAMGYVKRAFDASSNDDFNLYHIAGMCKRRTLEYYKHENQILDFQDLRQLVEEARVYFEKSRRINAKNIHAYISDIQLLVILMEYGLEHSGYKTYRSFLFSSENEWYLEQYVSMTELIDTAKILLGQMETLGKTGKIIKSNSYLHVSESKSIRFIDDIPAMLKYLSSTIEHAALSERPRLRYLYVKYLLLSKLKDSKAVIYTAFDSLSRQEQDKVEDYLNKNIQQGNTNIYSMRMWFLFVRHCKTTVPVEEIISRLMMLANSSENQPILHLETMYNLYVLKAFRLLRESDSLNRDKVKEIEAYIDSFHDQSVSRKYIFDLLEHTKDISGIVPFSPKLDYAKCERFEGTIVSITSETQGTIRLDCGLMAFFAPSVGKFIMGQDETKRVTFAIGFRYDGLCALDVHLVDEPDIEQHSTLTEEISDQNDVDDIDNGEEVVVEYPEIPRPHLKILGSIDLSKIRKR